MGEERLPRFATAVLTAACIAYPWIHPGARGPSPAVEPMLVSAVALGLLLVFARGHDDARVPRSIFTTLLAFMAALWCADALARGMLDMTAPIVSAWIVFVGIAGCAVWTRTVCTTDHGQAIRWLASGWLAAALASTLIALAQYAGVEGALGSWATPSPLHHAYANLRQRNHYATLVSIGLASLAWLAMHAQSALQRILAAIAALFLCAGLAASASRTGMLELFVLLLLWMAWQGGRAGARGALALGAAYVAIGAILLWAGGSSGVHGVMQRLAGDAPDCHGRRILWTTMVDLIAQRPQGWGWHELPLAAYGAQTQPHFCALVENAHNLPLHVAVGLGIPVAAIFLIVCVVAVTKAKPWRERGTSTQLGWAVIAVLAIHSLLEYPLWYGPFQMALGFALGLVWRDGPSWTLRPATTIAAGCTWLALVGLVAFDYARVSQPYLPVGDRWQSFAQDPVAHARRSWLFRDQATYAELLSTPLTPQTAPSVFALSQQAMHYAPEPRVIEKGIASAALLGRAGDVDAQTRRYARAYPDAYAQWASRPAR